MSVRSNLEPRVDMARQSVLDIQGLSVAYHASKSSRVVVDDFNLTMMPGSMTAVVGESGSGKSTVAQSIIGLLPGNGEILKGKIFVGGLDTVPLSDKRMQSIRGRQVGLVPQDPGVSLNPVRTIGNQLGEIFRIHDALPKRMINARVLELLERVGLSDPPRQAEMYPHQLSGGMRQRVLIASAIALEPPLIIADEPTSALDVTVQAKVLDLLENLRREMNTAILMITHDLAVATDRATNVVVMRHGVVEEQGDAVEVLTAPKSVYAQRLLQDAPSMATARRRPIVVVDQNSPNQDSYIIQAKDLVKEFRAPAGHETVRASDGVSFDVRAGTTHAIVGESGSGKSTAARMVLGLEKPTSGSVLLDGIDTSTLDRRGMRELRRKIQLIYQNPYASLNPRLDVLDAIQDPLRAFKIGTVPERRKMVESLLERTALPATVLKRKAGELSGGQRQRVAIARALALNPQIVVLDEAVSALDVTVQAQILKLLDELQSEMGLTYLFISHDLAVIRQIADTVSVMERGRIVESGETEQVYASPVHRYTQNLLSAVPGGGRVLEDLIK